MQCTCRRCRPAACGRSGSSTRSSSGTFWRTACRRSAFSASRRHSREKGTWPRRVRAGAAVERDRHGGRCGVAAPDAGGTLSPKESGRDGQPSRVGSHRVAAVYRSETRSRRLYGNKQSVVGLLRLALRGAGRLVVHRHAKPMHAAMGCVQCRARCVYATIHVCLPSHHVLHTAQCQISPYFCFWKVCMRKVVSCFRPRQQSQPGATPVLQPHLQQGSHNAIFDIRFLVHSHRMLQPSLQHLSRRPHRCARLKSHTARPPQPAYAASISDLNLSTTALRLSFCAFVTSPLCGVHSSGLRMTS
jgi:hypothetical protein